MKLFKRLISTMLALLMIFALAACGGGSEPSDKPDNGGGAPPVDNGGSGGTGIPEWEPTMERPVEETTGKNYVIIQHTEIENPFGYSQDSNMGLQISERIIEVSETFGCTFEFSQIPYNDSFASQLQALLYSDNGGDLIYAHNNAKLRLALGTGGSTSLCQDLLEVDHIINFWDFNKWGNITARECMMAGGTFYGVSPALWVDSTPLPYYTVVYNKDIVAGAGATDPQEYWEKEEWDRYSMLEVIQTTTDEVSGVWGMSATLAHMVRATFLTTGQTLLIIDKIHSDGTVEWSHGMESGDVVEAFQWLKNTLTSNSKCFNNGQQSWDTWNTQTPFNEELCAMSLTRPADLFQDIVVEGPSNFGIITWAGDEANTLTGYYEMVPAIAIPLCAQSVEHSAFLMADLFEGLGDIETYDDVIDYYSETYFNSELDILCLVREGAALQYSYWPNGIDSIWSGITSDLLTASSVAALVEKYVHTVDTEIETHIMPNTVALEAWRQAGYFD